MMMQAAASGDAEIAAAVRTQLRRHPPVDRADVHVEAREGVVTLSGTVERSAERSAAEEAAHRVSGVRGVANELKVRVPGSPLRTDGEIAQAVRRLLCEHSELRHEQIFITVSDAWVTLEGGLASCKSCEEAERLVLLSGVVRGVTTKLQVEPPGQKPEVRGTESGGGRRMTLLKTTNRVGNGGVLQERVTSPAPIHLLSRQGLKTKPAGRPEVTHSGEPISFGRVPEARTPEPNSAAGAFMVNTYWSACGHISSLDHLIAQAGPEKERWVLELMATIERLRMEAAHVCLEHAWGTSLRSGGWATPTVAGQEGGPAPRLDAERCLVDLQERRWRSYLRGGHFEGTHLCSKPPQPA